MKRIIAGGMICALTVTTAFARPAQTTANVNFRSGPGASNSSLGVLDAGTNVELINCDDSGSWCAIEANGQSGFVSGKYLEASGEDDNGSRWPRAFDLEGDAFVVLYQPQFSAWDDFRTLDAVVAAEYRENEDAEPFFGVIGLRGDTARDTDSGTVIMTDMEVTQLDFGALGRNEISQLSAGVGKLLPTDPLTINETLIVASLANYQKVNDVDGLKADPPVIFSATGPARLLQTDGEAAFAPVKGAAGVEFVINTNWDLFRVDDMLWVRDDTSWLSAPALDGPWEMATDLADALADLPDDGNWDDARAAIPPVPYDNGAPQIFYSDEAAELISFHGGEPDYQDVPGGDLQWASNSESDVFRMKTTGTIYYLVSGRWFSADSLDGPWTFATPDLPSEFLNIPDDVPYYTVRASVPGSSEANESRLRASIPELAFVNPNEITPPEITYDGDPKFEPIDGTKLSYAVNTEAQVIQVEDKYFLVYDGIWFVSDTATGPWAAASDIPDEIYDIPPSSPVYNTTYVQVYESSNDQIVYGYNSGYMWGFMAWGLLVYGSGYHYRPYWRYGHRPIYYPRPLSYGGGMYYNPRHGGYGRYGYAYGPHRGIQARSSWNPRTGTYRRSGSIHGPGGSRGFVSAYNPRTGTRAAARGGSNVYGSWGSAGVKRGSEHLRVKGGQSNRGGGGVKWDSSRGNGFAASGRRGNTFAGRDGNVYRKTDDGWSKWDKGNGWTGTKEPRRETLQRNPSSAKNRPSADRNRPSTKPANRPNTRPSTGATKRPATSNRVPSHISNDAAARNRTNQRNHQNRATQTRQPSRTQTSRPSHTSSASRNRSGGGAHRSGGGGGAHRGGGGGGRRR